MTVTSGGHSEIPLVVLSKKKVFAVDSLTVNYDPLFMQTTLLWNLLDTALVDRYVFFLNRETNFKPIETVGKNVSRMVFDLFPDSTKTSTYQIAAIDIKGIEGPAVIGKSFVKTSAIVRSETVAANKLDMKYKAAAGIDFMKSYSDSSGSNELLGNYFLYSNCGLDSNGNTYMKVYNDSINRPGVNYTVNLVRFNANTQAVKKMYLYNSTAPSLAKTVVAQNGTVFNISRNSRNDNPNDFEFNASEYDSTMFLLLTIEKKVLARMPLNLAGNIFFDNSGNLCQSLYNELGEVDSIAKYPTAQLLNRK